MHKTVDQDFRRLTTRRIVAVAFVLAISAVRLNSAAESHSSDFVFEIIPSQNAITPGTATWKTGAPVFFIIRMKNNSEHVLHFALTNPAYNYRATVLDSEGKPVPATENLRRLREYLRSPLRETTRNILVEMKPQETRQDGIEISYLYDLSKPGEYTVRLERDLPPEIGSGIVKSNTVRITLGE